jgi:hypothetical protein
MADLVIDGWRCEELYPGTDWTMRTAACRWCEVEADTSGIAIHERGAGGYLGASGSTSIPANVFMWLAQAVRL